MNYTEFKNSLNNRVDVGSYTNVNIENKTIEVYYILSESRLEVLDFWTYFIDYHIEKMEALVSYSNKAEYLKRIIPQMGNLLITLYNKIEKSGISLDKCLLIKQSIDIKIERVKHRLSDIERYLTETKQAPTTNDQPKTKAKRNPITAPVLGLFCSLVNESAITVRKDGESETNFCKRVCDTYKIKSNPLRVRQYFVNYSPELKGINLKYVKVIQELILKDLQNDVQEKIQALITSKTKTFA